MIHRIQKQHCIWPQDWVHAPHVSITPSRLDKVIGLVPQAQCLFKIFVYEQDLISRSDLEQCVINEMSTLNIWPHTEHYHLVFKQQDQWQVMVWLWDASQIEFTLPITHLVPALAFELGRIQQKPALLLYGEASDSWACYITANGSISAIVPLSSRIHRQKIQFELSGNNYSIYQAGHSLDAQLNELLAAPESAISMVTPLAQPKNWVLDAGRKASLFDFNSPWRLYKQMAVVLGCLLLFVLVDYTLINLKDNAINEQKATLIRGTEDLVSQRSQQLDMDRVLNELNNAFISQQRLALLIEAMTSSLKKDVVLNQLQYRNNKIELQGVVADSVALLERLAALPSVSQARFIGDITPNSEGRQTFRAELLLEVAE